MIELKSLVARSLQARAICRTGYPYYRTYTCSRFHTWGRWVLAGILIFVGLCLLAIFLCLAARRRRARARYTTQTQTPMTAPAQPYNNAPYNPPPGEGANQGYYNGGGGGAPQQYGEQQYGQTGGGGYAPPPGPPPATYAGGYK